MSDLGKIVKTAADDMAEGGEKAGKSIIEHYKGIGTELKAAAGRYRGVEADAKRGFTYGVETGAQDAERAASTLGKDATRSADTVKNQVTTQAEQDTKNLAHDTEQEAQEDAHLDGEGGATDDPIDVVTGEMFLVHRDLSLAGTIPLVLERRHGSAYRHGRLFGATWASTLDQRVEIDADGIHVALADGRVLHYPVPTVHGQQVMPSHGPRWPLTWNRTDDVITVRQDDLGCALAFHPGPTPDIRRPIAAVTDRAGNRITFVYDADGVPTDVYHCGGYHLEIACAETRGGIRVSAIKLADPAGGAGVLIREFRYDLAGRLVGVVNTSRKALTLAYDAADRITQWTDRNGYSYRYFYRADGRAERAEGDGGYLNVTLDYDLAARSTTVIDALGHATVYHWNEQGQTVKVTDPLGRETHTERDEFGHVVRNTDALGRTTRITRNAFGDAVGFERADGSTLTLTYTEDRNPLTVTGPDAATWSYAYDERGLPSAVTDPAGAVVRMTRGQHGELRELIDALGADTRIESDAAGLPVEVTYPNGAVARLRRDMFGRITELVDPLGAVIKLAWSTEGDLLSRTYPDGTAEAWEYDAEGNLLSHTSPTGARTRYEYGAFDTAVRRAEPDGTSYEFGYDAQLRLTTVTNPAGSRWCYEYDPAGQLTAETDFDGARLTYTHDAAGQLLTRTNAAGQTISYERDLLGRVVRRQSGPAVYTYSYDAAGRLTAAHGPGSELSYSRDALGRILTETVNGRTVTSTYDAAGNRISRRTPGAVLSEWAFDALGQPTTLTGPAGQLAFTYDQAGRETTRTLGPAASLTQSFDEFGRLAGQGIWAYEQPAASDAGAGGWRAVQTRTYSYRADGMPTDIHDTLSGPRTLTLDATGRISSVTASGWTESYAYDTLGNLAHTGTGLAQSDADGERENHGTRTARAGRVSYSYDDAGRVIGQSRRTLSGQSRTWRYAWNADDQLVQVTDPDGSTWRYAYDPLGRRIAKDSLDSSGASRAASVFTWDGAHLAEEQRTTADGQRTDLSWDYLPQSFIPAAQTRRCWVDTATDGEIDAEFHAIVTDLTGAPSELVAPDGTIAWHTTRSVWGKTVTAPDATTECPLGFPGQYHDTETGLWYNLNRYYDPETAAYLSTDPLGLAAAPNPRTYVTNPYVYSDPLGLQDCVTEDPTWGGRVKFGNYDNLGRPTGISATIEKDMIGKGTKADPDIRPPGFAGGMPNGDHARGHLLGKQLGGSGDEGKNLVTLYQNPVNTPIMSKFERQVRLAVEKGGETVEYTATPHYTGTQLIPRAVTLEAHGSGGFHLHVTILNRKP
ncbi:MAG TPA: DNA/RNA non-specific endonuclease [Actinospica sp.]|nr:DNA/RNA non-specific endonuclease [Actinospica sp.]